MNQTLKLISTVRLTERVNIFKLEVKIEKMGCIAIKEDALSHL